MKINIFQILNFITMGMQVVESFKGPKKTKTERINSAIDIASPFVQALEASLGKDLLKEDKIKPLVESYITAAKTLVNGIQEFKDLKVSSVKQPSAPKVN